MSFVPTPRAQSHLLLLLVLTLLFGLVEIPMPIGPDQGILAYVAMDILDGGVPYLTSWDHKPPGAHYLVALGFRIFGEGPTPLRLFDLVYMFLIVAVTYRIGAQLFHREAGLWAGVLFLVTYYTGTDWWNKCQPDEYMLLPLLLSVSIILGDPKGTRWWTCLLAGACLGAAFLVKFVAVVAAVPILFWYLRHVSLCQQSRQVLKDVGLFLGGFLVPNVILALWLWWTGAVGGCVDALFGFNYYYSQQGRHPPWEVLSVFASVWLLTVLALLPLAAVSWLSRWSGGLLSQLRSGAPGVVLGCVLVLVLVLEVVVQGKLHRYHLIPVFLSLCLLGGLGLHLVSRATHVAATRHAPTLTGLAILPATILAICTLLPFAQTQAYKLVAACAVLDGAMEREAYYQSVGGFSDGNTFSYVACRRAARYVHERTEPTDTVYVWGFDPVVNVLAGRRMPTRFSYNTPLIVPWRKQEWRQQFIAEMEKEPPRYLLVLANDAHPWTTGRSDDSYQVMTGDFPALARLVADHYELEATVQSYRIYRHR